MAERTGRGCRLALWVIDLLGKSSSNCYLFQAPCVLGRVLRTKRMDIYYKGDLLDVLAHMGALKRLRT